MTLADEIAIAVSRAVSPLAAKLDRIEKLHADLLTKRPTQKQLAKRLGVHPVTISRRKARAAQQLRLGAI
jgi:hypothetical protein